MTQTEAIADAIRSFDWAKHGLYSVADALEGGAPAHETAWVESLAAHIREGIQGSRWQPIDPATGKPADTATENPA